MLSILDKNETIKCIILLATCDGAARDITSKSNYLCYSVA